LFPGINDRPNKISDKHFTDTKMLIEYNDILSTSNDSDKKDLASNQWYVIQVDLEIRSQHSFWNNRFQVLLFPFPSIKIILTLRRKSPGL